MGPAACAPQNPGTDAIASQATAPPVEPDPGTRIATRDTYLVPAAAQESDYGSFSRHVNGTAGLLGIMLKTYTTDPLVRPFSTARSLGFLIKNTLADFATHTLISMVRLPEATKTPVPPVTSGPWRHEHRSRVPLRLA
jgi:hypothetical protein